MVFLSVLLCATVLFPFDRKRKLAHAQGFWWADALVAANPFWDIKARGLENIDRHKAYVIVANHQSMADIVMAYKTHIQFKWVAKDILFKVPVFGWCMSGMKYIRISRGEFGSIKDVYEEAGEWLRKGVSVLFFPEGTRSATGEMSPFKNGAFKLAIKEKKPVLPMYIEGARDIIPRGSWIFKGRAHSRLIVLPAVETSGYQPEDFARLRDTVRERLESEAAKGGVS
jgi:1-acyl-sn-glycerol-3-phosphate acyltransferase